MRTCKAKDTSVHTWRHTSRSVDELLSVSSLPPDAFEPLRCFSQTLIRNLPGHCPNAIDRLRLWVLVQVAEGSPADPGAPSDRRFGEARL